MRRETVRLQAFVKSAQLLVSRICASEPEVLHLAVAEPAPGAGRDRHGCVPVVSVTGARVEERVLPLADLPVRDDGQANRSQWPSGPAACRGPPSNGGLQRATLPGAEANIA